MNKRQLYNSIMENVGKHVKRALNEGVKAPMAGEISHVYPELTFKKCFMMYDDPSGAVIVFGYDTYEELCDLYGIELDDRDMRQLEKLHVGETMICIRPNSIYTRIK